MHIFPVYWYNRNYLTEDLRRRPIGCLANNTKCIYLDKVCTHKNPILNKTRNVDTLEKKYMCESAKFFIEEGHHETESPNS